MGVISSTKWLVVGSVVLLLMTLLLALMYKDQQLKRIQHTVTQLKYERGYYKSELGKLQDYLISKDAIDGLADDELFDGMQSDGWIYES